MARRRQADYGRIMACMVLSSSLFILWTSQFWYVQDIQIKGASEHTKYYVQQFIKNQNLKARHVLTLNPLALKKELETNTLLKNVSLEREIWPGRLTFKVQERQPRYLLRKALQKGLALSNENSRVIDSEGIVLPLDVGLFDVQGPDIYLKSEKNEKQVDAEHLNLVHQISALYKENALTQKGIFDISNPQNLMFYFEDPALKVWLGRPEDLVIKMQLVAPTREASKVKETEIDYIDLRFWKHPVIKTRS